MVGSSKGLFKNPEEVHTWVHKELIIPTYSK
jgi:hypothetical protein